MKRMTPFVSVLCGVAILLRLVLPAVAVTEADKGPPVELTRKAEAAIDKGLRFLAKTQKADGTWRSRFPVATSALALIAFMMRGHFPGEEPFGEEMERSLDYLLKESKVGGGYLGLTMYSHGLATLALSELWGHTDRDDEVRKALKAAVDVILRSQDPSGGWRYHPRPSGADVSVTVMEVVALASARQAGILVPDRTIERAIRYVKRCYQPQSGGFLYTPTSRNGQPGFARTAAGTFALMMCGKHESSEVKGGIQYLNQQGNRKFRGGNHYFYAHYYAVQVMHQAGPDHFAKWYPQIRDVLVATQKPDGSWKGGARDAGPVYAASMAVIILATPYRFVPAYQK